MKMAPIGSESRGRRRRVSAWAQCLIRFRHALQCICPAPNTLASVRYSTAVRLLMSGGLLVAGLALGCDGTSPGDDAAVLDASRDSAPRDATIPTDSEVRSDSPSDATTDAPSVTGSLGCAGPSVVTRVALGVTEAFPEYDAWDGRVLRNLNGSGMDGCDTYRWAGRDGRGDYCWANYEEMLSAHSGTNRIHFMIAFRDGRVLDLEETREVLLDVQSACAAHLAPGAQCTVIVSGLPDYIDTCGDIGTSGLPETTRDLAAQLAATTPDVVAGPAFASVSAADTTDGCHQDSAKRAEHAAQLLAVIAE